MFIYCSLTCSTDQQSSIEWNSTSKCVSDNNQEGSRAQYKMFPSRWLKIFIIPMQVLHWPPWDQSSQFSTLANRAFCKQFCSKSASILGAELIYNFFGAIFCFFCLHKKNIFGGKFYTGKIYFPQVGVMGE